METPEIIRLISAVVLLVGAIVLVVIVLFQSNSAKGLSGAIAGGSETFYGKNKGKSVEKKLFGKAVRAKKLYHIIHNVSAVRAVNTVLTSHSIRRVVGGIADIFRFFGINVEFDRRTIIFYVCVSPIPKATAANRADDDHKNQQLYFL